MAKATKKNTNTQKKAPYVVVMSNKGGVGKSSTIDSILNIKLDSGSQIQLMDLDSQDSSPWEFIREQVALTDSYDEKLPLLVDTGGVHTEDDELLTQSTHVLLMVTPEMRDQKTVEGLVLRAQELREMQQQSGQEEAKFFLVLNKFNEKKKEHLEVKSQLEKLVKETSFLQSELIVLPHSGWVSRADFQQKPVHLLRPSSPYVKALYNLMECVDLWVKSPFA